MTNLCRNQVDCCRFSQMPNPQCLKRGLTFQQHSASETPSQNLRHLASWRTPQIPGDLHRGTNRACPSAPSGNGLHEAYLSRRKGD